MGVFLTDPDFVLYVGDVREQLTQLPDASVDCVVTSPPYWGLRDYGTAEWEGGDPGCSHSANGGRNISVPPIGGQAHVAGAPNRGGRNTNRCDCGAFRVDQQIGLEATPQEYVASMVEVFREVWRVLAPHGTVWLNIGDSYASAPAGNTVAKREIGNAVMRQETADALLAGARLDKIAASGLKQKDMVGIPWRVAFALQDDGWYLRSDIIWSKPNPMPESVTDRPTKAHEYVFLLSKQPRYYFDQEAVREPHTSTRWGGPTITQLPTTKYAKATAGGAAAALSEPGREWNAYPEGGRNVRTVWDIATQSYEGAHFATFPEELPRRAIKAGCPEWVCRVCGQPRERIVERGIDESRPPARRNILPPEVTKAGQGTNSQGSATWGHYLATSTTGWSDCGHGADYRPGVVLDPFMGAGTTALVARKLARHSVGIELNQEYAELACRRLQQLSLFA